MLNINKIVIAGNIGKDAQIKESQNGNKSVVFSVATSESYKDKQGEWQNKSTWHNVELWGDYFVNNVSKYTKGLRVYIEGKQEHNEYEKDGVKRYFSKIVGRSCQIIDKQPQQGNEYNQVPQQQNNQYNQMNQNDDVPF